MNDETYRSNRNQKFYNSIISQIQELTSFTPSMRLAITSLKLQKNQLMN